MRYFLVFSLALLFSPWVSQATVTCDLNAQDSCEFQVNLNPVGTVFVHGINIIGAAGEIQVRSNTGLPVMMSEVHYLTSQFDPNNQQHTYNMTSATQSSSQVPTWARAAQQYFSGQYENSSVSIFIHRASYVQNSPASDVLTVTPQAWTPPAESTSDFQFVPMPNHTPAQTNQVCSYRSSFGVDPIYVRPGEKVDWPFGEPTKTVSPEGCESGYEGTVTTVSQKFWTQEMGADCNLKQNILNESEKVVDKIYDCTPIVSPQSRKSVPEISPTPHVYTCRVGGTILTGGGYAQDLADPVLESFHDYCSKGYSGEIVALTPKYKYYDCKNFDYAELNEAYPEKYGHNQTKIVDRCTPAPLSSCSHPRTGAEVVHGEQIFVRDRNRSKRKKRKCSNRRNAEVVYDIFHTKIAKKCNGKTGYFEDVYVNSSLLETFGKIKQKAECRKKHERRREREARRQEKEREQKRREVRRQEKEREQKRREVRRQEREREQKREARRQEKEREQRRKAQRDRSQVRKKEKPKSKVSSTPKKTKNKPRKRNESAAGKPQPHPECIWDISIEDWDCGRRHAPTADSSK